MLNLDVIDLLLSEIKSLLKRAKWFVFWSIPIGAASGAIRGVSEYRNSYLEPTETLSWTVTFLAIAHGIGAPLIIVGLILLYVIFWFPSIVAKRRGHAYVSIIQILNIAALFTGVTWFIAAGWAIFPSEKSLIDPVVGNPTGVGRRNAGDTIGAAKQGFDRGKSFEEETDKQIQNLIEMRSKGLLTDDEFLKAKLDVLKRES